MSWGDDSFLVRSNLPPVRIPRDAKTDICQGCDGKPDEIRELLKEECPGCGGTGKRTHGGIPPKPVRVADPRGKWPKRSGPSRSDQRGSCRGTILVAVQMGHATTAAIRKATGLGKSTVQRHLATLRTQGRVVLTGRAGNARWTLAKKGDV